MHLAARTEVMHEVAGDPHAAVGAWHLDRGRRRRVLHEERTGELSGATDEHVLRRWEVPEQTLRERAERTLVDIARIHRHAVRIQDRGELELRGVARDVHHDDRLRINVLVLHRPEGGSLAPIESEYLALGGAVTLEGEGAVLHAHGAGCGHARVVLRLLGEHAAERRPLAERSGLADSGHQLGAVRVDGVGLRGNRAAHPHTATDEASDVEATLGTDGHVAADDDHVAHRRRREQRADADDAGVVQTAAAERGVALHDEEPLELGAGHQIVVASDIHIGLAVDRVGCARADPPALRNAGFRGVARRRRCRNRGCRDSDKRCPGDDGCARHLR